MRFIVCVKQVPDTTEVKVDSKTNTLVREGVPSILNPFCQFALEEAVRLKGDDDEIIVISMGPPQAQKELMKCLALGADKAVLLTDRGFAGADTFATAHTLSVAIKKIKDFDVIFCGYQAIDGDTAQVGPELAALLGIPQVTYVENIEEIRTKRLVAKCQTDEGYKIVEAKMPVLLTGLTPSSFEPTSPPLPSIIRAKKKPFTTWTVEDLGGDKEKYGLAGSPTQVTKVYTPPPREQGVIITDEPIAAAEKLVELLVKDKVI